MRTRLGAGVHGKTEGGFYLRAPVISGARSGVYRSGSRRAVADLNENDDVDCRTHPDLPPLSAPKAEVDAFIAMTNGACWLFNELFPGGFTLSSGLNFRAIVFSQASREVIQIA